MRKDFLIPADAEIVVEGLIDLKKKEICGPWEDVMRYFSPQTLEPRFTPTAYLFRQNPICIGNWTGHDSYGVLAAMALGSFAARIKNVILVDDDIDPFDLNLVMFAVSTWVDAGSAQVQIIRDLQANLQDPSAARALQVGGLIIDATKLVGKPFPDIGKPPDSALACIRLEDFVSAAELGKLAG